MCINVGPGAPSSGVMIVKYSDHDPKSTVGGKVMQVRPFHTVIELYEFLYSLEKWQWGTVETASGTVLQAFGKSEF